MSQEKRSTASYMSFELSEASDFKQEDEMQRMKYVIEALVNQFYALEQENERLRKENEAMKEKDEEIEDLKGTGRNRLTAQFRSAPLDDAEPPETAAASLEGVHEAKEADRRQ